MSPSDVARVTECCQDHAVAASAPTKKILTQHSHTRGCQCKIRAWAPFHVLGRTERRNSVVHMRHIALNTII